MKYVFLALLLLTPLTTSAMPILQGEWVLPTGLWQEWVTETGHSFWVKVIGAIVTPAKAKVLSMEEEVLQFIRNWSAWEGADGEFLSQLAACESWLRISARNDHEPKGGVSYGLFQWQVGSWAYYNKVFGTNFDRLMWTDQVKLTTAVVSKYGSRRDWVRCSKYILDDKTDFVAKVMEW